MTTETTFPEISDFRDWVTAELRRRSKTRPTPTITPFVRFTSGKIDPSQKYKFFTIGLHGYEHADNIFDLSYGSADVVGYGYVNGQKTKITSKQSTLTSGMAAAEGHHPIPGVTNVHVEWKGPTDPIRCDVSWFCYNTTQLEFLRQHFLSAGTYVVVEWGHQFSDFPNSQKFDFGKTGAEQELANYAITGRKGIIDNYVQKSHGNYNFLVGIITNQKMTATPDGGFECVTTVYSVAESIFGITNYNTTAQLPNAGTTGDGTSVASKDTAVVQPSDQTSVAIRAYTSISEFFSENGTFDIIVRKFLDEGEEVVHTHNNKVIAITHLIGSVSDTPNEVSYITWWAFIYKIIPTLFNFLQQAGIKRREGDFLRNINIKEASVGNNPYLLSTDPATMILVTQQVANKGDLFPASNIFTDLSNKSQNRGLLSKGVWLNVKAIKDVFNGNNVFFRDAMMALLTRMNNATANYWNLDISWDEEHSRCTIYDKNLLYQGDSDDVTQIGHDLDLYEFNSGTLGELLSFDFEGSWSKEVMAQLLLSSATATTGATLEGNGLLENTAAIFSTNTHAQVLNYTPLQDIIQQEIEKQSSTPTAALASLSIFSPQQSGDRVTQKTGAGRRPSAIADTPTAPIVARSGLDVQSPQFQNADADALKQTQKDIQAKFGDRVLPYVALSETAMTKQIRSDGFKNVTKVNNFIAPVPSDIDLTLTINGIAGIRMFDGFLVSKLPVVYKRYGMFIVNGLEETVTPDGWKTTIRGMYYFIWRDGLGPPSQRKSTGGAGGSF